MKYDPRKFGAQCDSCPRKSQSPVPPEGPAKASWCWLGQDPGAQEVKHGRPFVGPTGTRLTHIWEEACTRAGRPVPRSSIWITNAALCLPVVNGNEKESRTAVLCCRPRLMKELNRLHPDAGLLVMGKWAWFSLTNEKKGMGKVQGFHLKLDQPGAEAPPDLRR